MSIKITSQLLMELSKMTAQLVEAADNDPRLDRPVRENIQPLLSRISDILRYPWVVPLDSTWLESVLSENLKWPDDIQNIEAYLDFVCEGQYRSFGKLFAFASHRDSLIFQKKFQEPLDS